MFLRPNQQFATNTVLSTTSHWELETRASLLKLRSQPEKILTESDPRDDGFSPLENPEEK